MKCEKCGTENFAEYSFCRNCGNSLKKDNLVENPVNTSDNNSIVNNSGQVIENVQVPQNVIAQETYNNQSLGVYCQCGQKLEPDWKFCPNCHTPINVEIKNGSVGDVQNNSKSNGNEVIIISIYFFSVACALLLGYSYFFLIAIVDIITGKIVCPKSTVIKIFFWLTIVFVILAVVLLMWFMYLCAGVLGSCSGMG